ncbi:MAG: tetratricopeptide repeat protein [Niveispirillum sp.]|uniref:tetratricopeptide repeat protein n=1 Tax=Niveispirillum sp. TaxID=1917217 RepID=UPI003BA71873
MLKARTHAPRRRLLPLVALAAALMGPPVLLSPPALAAGPEITVSPEVGVPLQAAKAALSAKRYDQALTEIEKARAVTTATAQEKWAIELTRAAIYKAQSRFDLAANAFEAALSLVPMSADDQGGALETLSQLWYRAGDYAKSAGFGEKAMAAGRRSDAFRQMVAEAYYRSKQPQPAAKLAKALVEEQRKAGRAPSQDILQLLAASEFDSGNSAGYIKTLREQIQNGDNSKLTWLRLFDAMQREKPIPERLDLDWARLRLAAGAYENPDSYTEMAQRAMVEELPAEAEAVLAKGWALGILGKPGPKQERQQRLRDYAARQIDAQKQGLEERQRQVLADKDANAVAKLGMIRASLGQVDQGIALLQQALKGKLMSPAAVRLRLAMLQYRAGQAQAAAQTLASLPAGSDEARMGQIWALLHKGGT